MPKTAPPGTVWGSVVSGSNSGRKGKIGISVEVTEKTETNVKFHVEVWFWTIYSCSDGSNTLKFNAGDSVTSASDVVVSNKSISHKHDTGTGWSTDNQTKLYEYTSTTGYDRRHTNRTIKFYASFSGIAMLNGTMYASNSVTIVKKASYTVSFNANGGSNAPSSQTKWYGEELKLSSTKPTRTGYIFKGWATSSTAPSAKYPAGGSYTDNKAATLYAVWTLAYTKPRITNFSVRRVNQNGQNDDQGTICKVIFNWATDKAVQKITVSYRQATANANWSDIELTASGKSGSVSQNLSPKFSIDNSYEIKVTVSDGTDSSDPSYLSYVTRTLPSAKFLIDFKAGGDGIAIGKAAENAGFDICMDTKFEKEIDIYGSNPHLDFHFDNSTSDYTSRITESASGKVDVLATNGLFNNGEKVVLKSDLATSSVKLTVNANRLTDFSYTAKYVPVIPAVFVRIYGVVNIDMNTGSDYDIINIESNSPNYQTALSIKSAKNVMAVAKNSGVISIRPLETGIKNYPVYIAGFWFV